MFTFLFSKPVIIIVVLVVGLLSNYMLGDNNPLEELSEKIYKYETGKDIEFSKTPEDQKCSKKDIDKELLDNYETTYDESNKPD